MQALVSMMASGAGVAGLRAAAVPALPSIDGNHQHFQAPEGRVTAVRKASVSASSSGILLRVFLT